MRGNTTTGARLCAAVALQQDGGSCRSGDKIEGVKWADHVARIEENVNV